MPTAEKVKTVEDLAQTMKQAQGLYLTDFTGLNVPALTELRKRLREGEISCRVVKNRLALLAAREAGVEELEAMFAGPTGLVSSETDPIAPIRLLAEFARGAEGRPKVKAGLVDGRVYIDAQLEALATLPPREVLLAQVATAVQGPISGLVFCLSGALQKLVLVLNAIAKKEGEEAGGGAASAGDS